MENPQTPSVRALDPKLFRSTMGCFATSVTIVTTKCGDELHGMTANSLTSVSMNPTLVLVCLAQESRTAAAIQSSGWFAINILQEHQTALSNRFARPSEDHYAGLDYTLDAHSLPILPGCVAYLACRVYRIDPGGDHIIVIGEVVRAEFHDSNPLIFFRGAYSTINMNTNLEQADLNWYW